MLARCPIAPGVSGSAVGLSRLLRERTHDAHRAVEEVFAHEARLTTRRRYADLLHALRGFYGPVEAALDEVQGWAALRPQVDVRARRRAALLSLDLHALGGPSAVERQVVPPPLPTLAHGLGCLYVLEGSAVGGRIVAGHAARVLGPDLPLAFLTSAGRPDLGREWRELRAALDGFGERCPDEADAVVTAADQTFRALGAWLETEVPLP